MTFLRSLPRRIARTVRHLPDRLLHARRRKMAVSRVESSRAPESALFICLGNINRSAYAAVAFERAAAARGLKVRVRSAGFIGPGRPASEGARAAAMARQLDLGAHRSRVIDADEVRSTDLVVVMEPRQRKRLCRMTGVARETVVLLGDLDPEPITRRLIQDPYGHPPDVFERVFERVDRCVEELAAAVTTGGGPRRETE